MCEEEPSIVSPIGLVPKSNGGHRLIHDCSQPPGKSLNDYAVEFDKYSYESVDTAVSHLKQDYYMAKVDIKAAYRSVAIHPSSYQATGLTWLLGGRTVHMVDKRLPFGARASPTIFHRISQFVKRAMERRGHHMVVAYQDDFLVMGRTYDGCLAAWLDLINLLLSLGFDINYDKLEAPCKQIVFLGVGLDSENMELSLPEEKVDDISGIIDNFLGRKRVNKRQLQSLAGKLNYAAKVIRGGRTFLRRVFDSIGGLRRPFHKVRVQGALRKDLLWWQQCMRHFNGVAACIQAENAASIMADACNVGAGAFCDGNFMYARWDTDYPQFASAHINNREVAAAALAVMGWADHLRNRTVYIYTDNQCARAVINKCASRDSSVMALLRDMFWCSAAYNFHVVAVYVPGARNAIADAASRLHEHGQLISLESLINEWYSVHTGLQDAFSLFSLCNHMSLSTLCCIFPQVQEWQRLRKRWTLS